MNRYSLSQKAFAALVHSLTKKQTLLLKLFIDFYYHYTIKNKTSVHFGQESQAIKAGCCRKTVHTAMKKFESYGWIKIHSGKRYRQTNVYTATKEFEHIIRKTIPLSAKGKEIWGHILKLLKSVKKQPDFTVYNPDENEHFQRENYTGNYTGINNILTPLESYTIRNRHCGNVHNSSPYINEQLLYLRLSEKDKIAFSSYSDRVIANALEKAKYISQRYRLTSGLGALMNSLLRKEARLLN